MRVSAGLKLLMCASAAVLTMASAARAANVAVPMDEVRVVAFAQPVSTVYVGNPMIADITVIDSRHVFILGKAFGATNMIALDAGGKPISNSHVTVFDRAGSSVTLQRGVSRTTYACASAHCESAPMPGDAVDTYSAAMGQITQHQDAGAKSAAAVASNSGQ